MKTTLTWTIRHLKQHARHLRFTARCWWLSQQIDFCEWRMTVNAGLAEPRSRPVPAPQGGRHAVQSL
ncbi:MAG: hypothetical protein GDA68_01665 [Nitrospira sp. CR2.1]|nr:hypothetical protein [Nitrospira sp. CR2.1]